MVYSHWGLRFGCFYHAFTQVNVFLMLITLSRLGIRIFTHHSHTISKHKTSNYLGLSPAIVHNIPKRFSNSGEIYMLKGQGRKSLLKACDLRAIGQHCMKNCHATMMNLTTGARECCTKLLSLKVCRCIQTSTEAHSVRPKDCGTCFAVRATTRWTVQKPASVQDVQLTSVRRYIWC